MKRLCLAVAGLLAALCLAAAPADAGKKDDTLVWATDRDNPIADPYYLNTRELVVIGHQVWDTLVIIDPKTAEIKPLLATKWAWVNPTTLEMELRKGVKFHSGKVMDADDVVYTLNLASNKENAICQLRAACLDQERREDRRRQGAHQPQSAVPAGARLPRRPRLHHAEGALRQRAREARRQEGLRRRQAQRHRPLQDHRGQARRVHPRWRRTPTTSRTASRAIPRSPRSSSAPSRTATRAPPS